MTTLVLYIVPILVLISWFIWLYTRREGLRFSHRHRQERPPDYMEPMVLGFDPRSGQTGVARSASVAIEFSEAMAPDSIDASTVKLHRYDNKRKKWRPVGGAVVGCDAACDTATLDPHGASATLLPASTKHRVTVSGAYDVAGNYMLSSAKAIFTTGRR